MSAAAQELCRWSMSMSPVDNRLRNVLDESCRLGHLSESMDPSKWWPEPSRPAKNMSLVVLLNRSLGMYPEHFLISNLQSNDRPSEQAIWPTANMANHRRIFLIVCLRISGVTAVGNLGSWHASSSQILKYNFLTVRGVVMEHRGSPKRRISSVELHL